LTICTIDQIFDFVYRYKGFEPKLATLSYSKIIIDEIQMYSSDLVAYLVLGLRYITKMGGRFAIMTATLPQLILNLLKEEGIEFEEPRIFTNSLTRHSIKRMDTAIDDDESIAEIAKAYNNNKLLVICNTIKKAKEVYIRLKKVLPDSGEWDIQLLHSGFIRRDRSEKEDRIMKTGEKNSTESGIWVTTQLVEASLDIDFDLLYTELSDLNGLFQRMGRCYRHRPLNVEYNCFVFTGGSRKCSGIGENSVIEPEVHNLSREALVSDGVLDEDTKVEMIRNTYTADKLKNYYLKIKGTISYIKSISAYELDKKAVNEKFRNIDQILVIPLNVYKEYEADIKEQTDILNDKAQPLKIKIKAREKLRDLMVPVQTRLAEKTASFKLKINRTEEILVIDAEYTEELGISFENTGRQEFRDVESRMF
ncbi:MAG TPA: CRISPR-associated helicase Cas3', partial [Ruminiclostridium sp.]|nr:CRISPR-associated helicase Cas3' [Ruminiclostridium sp.]